MHLLVGQDHQFRLRDPASELLVAHVRQFEGDPLVTLGQPAQLRLQFRRTRLPGDGQAEPLAGQLAKCGDQVLHPFVRADQSEVGEPAGDRRGLVERRVPVAVVPVQDGRGGQPGRLGVAVDRDPVRGSAVEAAEQRLLDPVGALVLRQVVQGTHHRGPRQPQPRDQRHGRQPAQDGLDRAAPPDQVLRPVHVEHVVAAEQRRPPAERHHLHPGRTQRGHQLHHVGVGGRTRLGHRQQDSQRASPRNTRTGASLIDTVTVTGLRLSLATVNT